MKYCFRQLSRFQMERVKWKDILPLQEVRFFISHFFLPIPEPVWNITLTDLKRYQILLSRCAVMTQNSSSGNNNDSVLQHTANSHAINLVLSLQRLPLPTGNKQLQHFFSKMKKKKC